MLDDIVSRRACVTMNATPATCRARDLLTCREQRPARATVAVTKAIAHAAPSDRFELLSLTPSPSTEITAIQHAHDDRSQAAMRIHVELDRKIQMNRRSTAAIKLVCTKKRTNHDVIRAPCRWSSHGSAGAPNSSFR